MPAATFIAQATGTPQMLRDVGSARFVTGADHARARGLQQFPDTFDPKSKLNFAAFCQPSLPAGISCDARCVEDCSRCERLHFRSAIPVKIR
jgi:hypothetical protein